jgi:hypothetical protein
MADTDKSFDGTRASSGAAPDADVNIAKVGGQPLADLPRGVETEQPWGCPWREERWIRARRPQGPYTGP